MIQSCHGCKEDILPGMLHWARKDPPQFWHIHCALERVFQELHRNNDALLRHQVKIGLLRKHLEQQ